MKEQIIIALISGGTAAMVAGIFSLIMWGLNRRAQKQDRAEQRSVSDCAARGQEIQEVKDQLKVALLADRTILYDRIKYLGKSYIARGWVTVEELEDLNMMHAVYHDKDKLDGNGFLDNLMKTVNFQLEKRAK